MATLITALIHITATVVHFRDEETRPSITSMETRCVVVAVTQAAATQAAVMQAAATARNGIKLKRNGVLLRESRPLSQLLGSGKSIFADGVKQEEGDFADELYVRCEAV
jgi:hypothetical protein